MAETVEHLIGTLALEPHPEGGHYRRIYASDVEVAYRGALRPALTAIQFLLRGGECSQWHRVDADETWHWQQGGQVQLQTYDPATARLEEITLGEASLARGVAMHVVRAGHWQRARTSAAFVLVVCMVSPGFCWEGFALLDAAPEIADQLAALGVVDANEGPAAAASGVPVDMPNR